MRRMRSHDRSNRIFKTSRVNTRRLTALALFAVAAVCAAPALAAESVASGSVAELRLGAGKIAAWAEQGAAERRRRARAEGPFVPVIGTLDAGTAENAFGAARSGHVHAGQDLFAAPGTPLVAVADSVVIEAGSDGGQGNYAHLFDPRRGLTYVYMHMVEPASVREGERVRAGARIGGVGCTGSCWGDHLHFEVRDGRGFDAEARDPMPLIDRWRSLEEPR